MIVIFLPIFPWALQTCVMGSESKGQTNWPQSGHVFAAGLPQMWQVPIIVMATD